jgi:hypothetical protein
MKRALIPALVLALVFVAPALPQGEPKDEKALQKDVLVLMETVEAQETRIAALEAYVAATKAEAATLSKHLKKAEADGFTFPAPNTDSRKGLLLGLQRFAHVASDAKGSPPGDEPAEGEER